MHKLSVSILILSIALGLLGCSSADTISSTATPELLMLSTPDAYPNPLSYPNPPSYPNPSDTVPQLTGEWRIHMAQTGGIAGVSRVLEISSDGTLTITDERTKKQATSTLTPDQLAELTRLVASTQYQPVKTPMGCADCFIFNLQITNGLEKFQAQTDDVNMADSGLEPLVRFLGELLNSK